MLRTLYIQPPSLSHITRHNSSCLRTVPKEANYLDYRIILWMLGMFRQNEWHRTTHRHWKCINRKRSGTDEPRHDKPNKMAVRPAKTQISLGMRPVWSESSLSAWRNLWFSATLWALCKDSDQTGRMPRLIWAFAGRKLIWLVLPCRCSIIIHTKRRTIQTPRNTSNLSCDEKTSLRGFRPGKTQSSLLSYRD